MQMDVRQLVARTEEYVAELFAKYQVPEDHGLEHCRQVRQHAELVLEIDFPDLPEEIQKAILLAALLHDVDDRKLFPKNSQNAREILQQLNFPNPGLVLDMIAKVSTKENGQQVDPGVPEWHYVVRDCDRLEALGEVGVKRCVEFAARSGLPVCIPETQLPKTEAELDLVLKPERFVEYQLTGRSASMLDHFFDKLLWLKPSVSRSMYLAGQFENRIQYMRKVVLDLCQQLSGRPDRQPVSYMLIEDDLAAANSSAEVHKILECAGVHEKLKRAHVLSH
jgi:uncharacterized protein